MMIIGMSNGNDKIAIKVPLLLAFDAIAEIMEKVVAKAIAPKMRDKINEALSTMGYPEVTVKNNKAIPAKNTMMKIL